MAEITKKLYYKKGNEGKQAIILYDSKEDVENNFLSLKVDNKNVYVALGESDDTNASALKVKKNNKIWTVLKEIFKDFKYKMSDIYPDTYKTMTKVDMITVGKSHPRILTSLEKTSHMFENCHKLPSISNLAKVNTSNVTDMSYMFYGCTFLTSIPQLNTNKVTDMSGMFGSCANLASIPRLNTSNVTSMSSMFSGCYDITSIPQLDASKVIGMTNMFNSCTRLSSIPQLNTSKVKYMQDMFFFCQSLSAEFPWTIDCSSVTDANKTRDMFGFSSVTKVRLKNVNNSIKSQITPQLLKQENASISIVFV